MTDNNSHKLALSESFERVAKVAKEREAFNEAMDNLIAQDADLIDVAPKVTDADRQAAFEYMKLINDRRWSWQAILDGGCDNTSVVLAFARHRMAATREAIHEIARIKAENYVLAAGSCDVPNGKIGDQRGNFYCSLQRNHAPDAKKLVRALVDHNDALRSASSIAQRDGAETNWKSFRGVCTYTLAEHHETTNEARAALEARGLEI